MNLNSLWRSLGIRTLTRPQFIGRDGLERHANDPLAKPVLARRVSSHKAATILLNKQLTYGSMPCVIIRGGKLTFWLARWLPAPLLPCPPPRLILGTWPPRCHDPAPPWTYSDIKATWFHMYLYTVCNKNSNLLQWERISTVRYTVSLIMISERVPIPKLLRLTNFTIPF